jgi:hypothetical protein
MRQTPERLRALTKPWPADRFEKSYAAGKWSGRLVIVHLAQTELALGTRARMALTVPAYAAQAFDQDDWLGRESRLEAREAVDAFCAVAAMNARLFGSLTAAERAIGFSHPEYGSLTIDWLIHQLAGHQIHHLRQLETIDSL